MGNCTKNVERLRERERERERERTCQCQFITLWLILVFNVKSLRGRLVTWHTDFSNINDNIVQLTKH